MKKIFLTAGIIITAATVTFAKGHVADADHKEAKKENREIRKEERLNLVSDLTKHQFAEDFPDASKVTYEKTSHFDEVIFMSGSNKLRAYYDWDIKLVGTTQKVNFEELPGKAKTKILEKYPDYNIISTIKFDDNEDNATDMILFENSFEDADNYFVELEKQGKDIILKIDMSGEVSLYK